MPYTMKIKAQVYSLTKGVLGFLGAKDAIGRLRGFPGLRVFRVVRVSGVEGFGLKGIYKLGP